MNQQYLRNYSLVVADKAGNGQDLSQLQARFFIEQGDTQTPNVLTIRVYNMSDQTAQRLQNHPTAEFSRVVLQAGYAGNNGVIFNGNIKYARSGHEGNQVNKYVEIVAADGDAAYNFANVNLTLAAGWTYNDVIKACLTAMGQVIPPVTRGNIPDYSGAQGIRGKVLSGMARDILREVARSVGATWTIQNGQLNFIPIDGYLAGDAIELTSATGLIGFPEQTSGGIRVRCLLNPQIGPGGRIHINNASVQKYAFPLGVNSAVANQVVPRLSDDGFYRVIWVMQKGDTRGNDWYTDMICVALNPSETAGPGAGIVGLNYPDTAPDITITVPQ